MMRAIFGVIGQIFSSRKAASMFGTILAGIPAIGTIFGVENLTPGSELVQNIALALASTFSMIFVGLASEDAGKRVDIRAIGAKWLDLLRSRKVWSGLMMGISTFLQAKFDGPKIDMIMMVFQAISGAASTSLTLADFGKAKNVGNGK